MTIDDKRGLVDEIRGQFNEYCESFNKKNCLSCEGCPYGEVTDACNYLFAIDFLIENGFMKDTNENE